MPAPRLRDAKHRNNWTGDGCKECTRLAQATAHCRDLGLRIDSRHRSFSVGVAAPVGCARHVATMTAITEHPARTSGLQAEGNDQRLVHLRARAVHEAQDSGGRGKGRGGGGTRGNRALWSTVVRPTAQRATHSHGTRRARESERARCPTPPPRERLRTQAGGRRHSRRARGCTSRDASRAPLQRSAPGARSSCIATYLLGTGFTAERARTSRAAGLGVSPDEYFVRGARWGKFLADYYSYYCSGTR